MASQKPGETRILFSKCMRDRMYGYESGALSEMIAVSNGV